MACAASTSTPAARDEYFLDLGAQAFAEELTQLEIQPHARAVRRRPRRHHLPLPGRDPRAGDRARMTATADTELAFAGPAALAAKVRAREVSPARAGRALPAADRGARPSSERVPRHARRSRRSRRPSNANGADGPLAGVPIAVKDDLAVAGQVGHPGLAQLRPTCDRRRRAGPPAARGRGDPDRDHQRARADDLPVDGHRGQRGDPQSVEPRAHARRLVGRLGERGRSRTGPRRDGLRRRRLDPDSGRLLWPGRDEADAGPGLRPRVRRAPAGWDCRSTARWRARVSDSALLLDVMHGAGPDEPDARAAVQRQLRGGGGHAARPAADRDLAQDPAGSDRERLAPSSAAPGSARAPCSAISATT